MPAPVHSAERTPIWNTSIAIAPARYTPRSIFFVYSVIVLSSPCWLCHRVIPVQGYCASIQRMRDMRHFLWRGLLGSCWRFCQADQSALTLATAKKTVGAISATWVFWDMRSGPHFRCVSNACTTNTVLVVITGSLRFG